MYDVIFPTVSGRTRSYTYGVFEAIVVGGDFLARAIAGVAGSSLPLSLGLIRGVAGSHLLLRWTTFDLQ